MDLLEKADSLSKEKRYFLLLAPACIFLSYFLLPTANLALPLGGLCLCLLFEKKGLYLSLLLLVVDSVIQHITHTNHFWLLGFELSIGGSFWIFSLALEQAKETEATIKDSFSKQLSDFTKTIVNLENQNKNLKTLDSNLKKIIENNSEQIVVLEKDLDSCKLLVDTLQISKDVNRKINERLTYDLIEAHQKIDAVNHLQAQLEKEKKELKSLKDLQLKKTDNKQKEFSERAKEQYRNMRQLQADYLQLKKQFKDKDEVLRQTRQALYQTQTRLEVVQLKLEERKHVVSNEEKNLTQEVETLLLEVKDLEAEIKDLESIISILSLSLKSKKTPQNSNNATMELPFKEG